MELKEAVEKISPQEYNKGLQNIELQDCYLKGLQHSCFSRNFSEPATFDFVEQIGDVVKFEEKASIEVRYRVKAASGTNEIFKLEAVFVFTYSLKEDLPDEFFVILRNYTLPLQGFPYIRELTQSITARAGLPTLVLPMRKFLLEEKAPEKRTKKRAKKN